MPFSVKEKTKLGKLHSTRCLSKQKIKSTFGDMLVKPKSK